MSEFTRGYIIGVIVELIAWLIIFLIENKGE